MRSIAILAAALAAASLEAPANAENPPDYAAMSAAEFGAVVQQNESRLFAESCDVGVPIVVELYRRTPSDRLAGTVLLLRSYCADERGEHRLAADLMQERERRFRLTAPEDYWLYLVQRAEDSDMAITLLDRLLESGEPATIAGISADRLYAVIRLLVRAGRETELSDLALRYFETRKFRHFDVDIQAALAIRALRAAARQDDHPLVPELLGMIRSPSTYIDMLAQRDYEPVWPAIEERAGANLANVAEDYAEWALARLRNAPDDRDRFSTAAYALHYAGRFEEAIELARRWREREGAFDTIEEGDAWAINIEAYALDSLGRPAEADARFDQLAALPADDYPWVVNFVINRASRLVGQKRYAEALEAATRARAVAEDHGTTYAKTIVAHDFVCALEGLGRQEETAPEMAFLLENRRESIAIVAEALMCLGRNDEAAEVVLEALADETMRPFAIDALQRPQFDLFYTASALPQSSDLLDRHEAVRREFERWGREIPVEFIPHAALRRAELRR